MDPNGPILVVDDEIDLLDLVELNLRREGFDTVRATRGSEVFEAVAEQVPSLILLDLMLPDMSGTEICRRLRADPATRDVPVIMVTAKGEEIDRVVGFEVGADDYVTKPFSTRELVLRVRAMLRRREGVAPGGGTEEDGESAHYEFGVLRIDEGAHRVWVAGRELQLTATEFKLLMVMVRRSGRVQTRGSLLQDVWDMPPDLNTRTVDTHVKRLREKLGAASAHVETVRGVGYRFNPNPGV